MVILVRIIASALVNVKPMYCIFFLNVIDHTVLTRWVTELSNEKNMEKTSSKVNFYILRKAHCRRPTLRRPKALPNWRMSAGAVLKKNCRKYAAYTFPHRARLPYVTNVFTPSLFQRFIYMYHASSLNEIK